MKNNNSLFSYSSLFVIIVILTSSLVIQQLFSIGYATSYLEKTIENAQKDIQSSVNNDVQKTIANTIHRIEGNVSGTNATSSNPSINNNNKTINIINEQGQNNKNPSLFQQKVHAIDNTPAKKVKVGDIEIAYKQFGNGTNPIVLITGLGGTMDMWSPSLLNTLANQSQYKVIIFDNRGAGESTSGTKNFTLNQFTNDTLGLLNALHIKKTNVLGWSMGSFIAQELAVTHPERVNNLILYASSCGGATAIPANPEVVHLFDNKSLTPEEFAQKAISLLFPKDWFDANPNLTNYFPTPHERVSLQIIKNQTEAINNWKGDCDNLANISSPTLLIVGTDDLYTPSGNSLSMVKSIPGAWLVQIKGAGHGLMYQYPEIFNQVVTTFLTVNKNFIQ